MIILLIRFLVTLAIGTVGGLLFRKKKVPAGLMLGSMVFVGLFSLSTAQAHYYTSLRRAVQIISGCMVGSRIKRNDFTKIKKLGLPYLILFLAMVIYNISFGYLLFQLSSLDPATALLAVSPGGAMDMSILASELGGSTPIVALLHVYRQIALYFIVPLFIRFATKIKLITPNNNCPSTCYGEDFKKRKINSNLHYIYSILFSSLISILFVALRVRSGWIIGAAVGGLIYSLIINEYTIPKNLSFAARIFAGSYIGVQIGPQFIASISGFFIPIVIISFAIIVLLATLPIIMHRLTSLSYVTCLLASSPGGLTEMSLLAEEMDADTMTVVILQTLRMLSVLILFPCFVEMIVGI